MTPAGSPPGQCASRKSSSLLDLVGEPRLHLVGAAGAHLEERPPAVDRQRVAPGERETVGRPGAAGPAPARRRRNGRRAAGAPRRRQERDDRRRPAGKPAQRLAVAVVHRQRAGDAAPGEMLHQAEEEGQVGRVDALLVERQDELALLGRRAGSWSSRRPRRCPSPRARRRDRSRRGRRRTPRRRIRCRPPSRPHSAASRSWRGRLKAIVSSAAVTTSTVTSKRSAKASITSSTRTSGADAPAVTPRRRDAGEARPVDLGGALDQHRERAAGALRHLAQPLRVGGVRRADDDHRVDLAGNALHRLLAVGGGVADVFLVRADDLREALA